MKSLLKTKPSNSSFDKMRKIREHNNIVSQTTVRMYSRFGEDNVQYTKSHHYWGDNLPHLRDLVSSSAPIITSQHFAGTLYGRQAHGVIG